MAGLTFEVRLDRRWDARPGLAKMYRVPRTAYRQAGLGGPPLVLRLSEGLGVMFAALVTTLLLEYWKRVLKVIKVLSRLNPNIEHSFQAHQIPRT